jgi:hypothetical protein
MRVCWLFLGDFSCFFNLLLEGEGGFYFKEGAHDAGEVYGAVKNWQQDRKEPPGWAALLG